MANEQHTNGGESWGKGDTAYKLIERLFPICRSITGNGVRQTLLAIQDIIDLDIVEVPSGTEVLDWEIPDEWNINDAWVLDPNGEKIIEFEKSNLHVLNYSEPVDKEISLSELKQHIYTLPDRPDLIPYRTSYYTKQWGFCMAHKQFENLKEGTYHVKIDSTLQPGALTYGEYFIPGKSEKEVLVSCHICHPSLCNDNLSGIAMAVYWAKHLAAQDLSFSYRFLFIPGTIGSIAWLSKNEDSLHKIEHGLVLALLGDPSPFHYKKTRRDKAEIDKILTYLLQFEEHAEIRDFVPYGYDERQFCSPGFNLPVGCISRKPFAEFPEYHTSADNLDFVKPEKLEESLELLFKISDIIESNKKWINLKPKGEPSLGKLGLNNEMSGQSGQKKHQMAMLWILNMSDGNFSILDIAMLSGIKFGVLRHAAGDLYNAGLLKEAH